jgi:hypothetical protein
MVVRGIPELRADGQLVEAAGFAGPLLDVGPAPQAGAAPHAERFGEVWVAQSEVADGLRVGEAESFGDHPHVHEVVDVDVSAH